MGYRFLDDYDPQKEKKKKQQNGALSAPRSSNSSNPFAANNSNKKQAAQPAGATQTTQNTRTTRGTALGGSAATPVQLPKQVTVPKLAKAAAAPIQKTTAPQQLKLPNIQAFGASMPTLRKQTAEKQTAEKQARKQAEIPEIKALGAGDYSAGAKKLDGFFARAGKTVLGGSKSALASNMDAMGAAYEAGQGQRTRINEAELREAQWAVARAKRDYDLDRSQTSKNALDAALTKMKAFSTVLGTGAYEQALTAAYDAAAKIGMSKDLSALYNSLGKVNVDASTGVQQRATEAARDLAMGVQASGGKDIEAAKKGLGGLGQMVVDVGASMTQTGIDTLLNTAMGTPGSKLPLAFRAFGGATQQARAEGGDTKGQNLYGSAMAAKEVATEMLFNIALPFAKAYGGGALDDIVQSGIRNAVDKLGKTEAGKRALNTLLQVAASGVSEGLEEFIGDWMEWQMPRLYGGEVSSAGETLANALYDFAVGGLSGIGGAAVTPATYQLRMPRLTTYAERQAAEYRGEKPQNVSNPRIGRLELSSEKYNPSGANVSTVYGNRYRQQVKEDAIRRLGIADGKPAYLVASNITKNGQEYYVDVTKASLNKLLFTKNHEPLELERLLLVDNLEKAIDGSYWAESNGDRKGRTQIDGFDTLRTSFYIDGIPYYADIKVKVVDKGAGQNPQNVAYYIEPEEITSIKKADTQSPTEGRHAPHIFFRDGVSAYMTSVPQSGTGVNIYAKESATLEGNGTDVPNTFTPEAAKPALSYAEKTRTSRYAMPSTQESAAPAINAQNGPPQSFSLKTSVPQAQESVNRLKMPQLVDEQGRTYEERVAWQQIPETQRAAFDEAQRIAQRFGARVVVDQQEGVNGSYRDGVISLNPNAANPVRRTLVHELTHHMESSGLYGEFRDMALRYVADNMGADVDSVRQAVMADYARSGVALDEDGATREIVAKFAEEKLFTDEATVRRLLAEDRNLFQRIYDWIRDMAGRLTGTSEESFLRSAEKLYAKALRETTAETGRGTAQYSFEQQPIPTWEQLGAKPDMQVVDIRENGFKLPYAVERNRILNSEEIQSLYRNPPVNKDTGELIFVTPATLTHSFSNSGENSIYATKHLREILENAVLTYAEPSRKADDNSTGVYTLFGAVQTETGIQPVKIKVKEYRIGSSVPKQTIADYFAKEGVVDPYAYAYDERVLALESIEKEELSSSATANTVQSPPLSHPSSSSTIRVQDLLRLVNSEYQKYVPEMANAEMNTVGAVTNNSQLLRGSAPAINSASEFSIPNNSGNVNTEQYSTGRGLDDLAGSSDYLDALARDENMFTSDAYTLADRLYDLQLRRVQQQEAPPERPAEQAAREDLDEIAELFTDQGNFFASRENRIRETENMVTDHTIEVGKSGKEKATEAWSYFYRKMVDAGHSVDKFAKAAGDPYLYQIYNQARASSSAGVSMITDAQTNVNAQKVGESLNGVFSPIRAKGEDYYRAFQLYMFDLHNIDRMSLSRSKEAAVLEATAALNEFDANHPEMRTSTEAQLARMTESLDPDVAELARERMQLLRNINKADAIKDKPVFSFDVTADVSWERARRAAQEHPEFEQYRQQVRTYIDNLMQYRVDSGLMTQADADYLKRLYPNYVPTMRKGGDHAGAGRDRNAVRIGRTVGRAEGGTADLVPLHEALGRQTMKVVREGGKNRFGQRLLNDFVRVGENSPAARYVQEAHEYEHEFTPDTLDDMSREQLTRDKTLTVFKDGKLWELTVDDTMFDALKALSPDAAESNAVRRAVRAANNLFKALVTGYNPTFTIRNTVRDLQTAGLYTRDGVAFARNYPKALAEIKNNGQYWQMYKALGGSFSSVFDYNTGTVKEPKGRTAKLMAKIEALNMTMEQAPRLAEFMGVVEKGGISQENLADALYAAADVTVNFGRAGTLGKVLNANYVPFLNPGIQGFDKLVRRVTETKGGREWAKLIIRAAALGVAPTLLNALLYHDDDEWDDLRDSDKDTNYLFKLGNGTWLKIPKGRELSLLGITADRIGDALRGENVALIATINTMGNQVAPANPLTSNIASALFEAQLFDPSSPGRTWYGGNIENQRLQSYAPGQRYDSSTDVFSKAVGGALGISPKKLNYVLDQYSGVVGDFLLPLLTPQAERDPFSKAFTVDAVTSNRLSGDFYDEADALTYAKNDGDKTAAVISRFWSKQQSACSDLYKQIREVEASDLPDREKRQKTRELKALVNGIQKNAMAVEDTYRSAVEKNLRQGMDTDDAYRTANRDCFGAEYALQVYNKDVYEKAKNARSNGVSYDDYYTYYFGTKGFKATDDTSVTTQKFDWLQSSGMDLTSQAEIYFADMASDKVLETQAQLEISNGITAEQFYQYKVASSGMTKKAEKLRAINSLDLTYAQKDALYYAEGWAQSTIGQAPWRGGYGGYSGGGYSSGGSGGNPFLRGSGAVSAASQKNPFLRTQQGSTVQNTQSNPFLRVRG